MSFGDKIEGLFKDKSIREFIYAAEMESPEMGEAESYIMKSFSDEVKSDKYISKKLATLSQSIKNGRPKFLEYKPYMSSDILMLIKEGEKDQISISTIFKGYVPNKELGTKIEASIRRKLIAPIIIFTLAVIGLKGALDNFKQMIDDGIATPDPILNFLMENFYGVNIAVGILAIFLFVAIPQKIPPIKGMFHKIEGLLVLTTINTVTAMGYSAGKARKTLIKIYKPKLKHKRYESDLDALMDLLLQKKYLSIPERAKLKIYAEKGKFPEGIKEISIKRKEEIEQQGDLVNEIVGKIGLVLLLVPLTIVIGLMLTVLEGAGT